MSGIAGAGADSYAALGGLFRVRLNSSENPKLQALGRQLAAADTQANALNDIINPRGFVGTDGKMKFIPGISFSNTSAIFDAIQKGGEISDELLQGQINHFAAERAKQKEIDNFDVNRLAAQTKANDLNAETNRKRYAAQAAATDAFLERAFGINKKKNSYSNYSNLNRVTDQVILGGRSGGLADYTSYNVDSTLTISAAKAISYDWVDDGVTSQTFDLKDFVKTQPTNPSAQYIVRLIGAGKRGVESSKITVADGNHAPAPSGRIEYTSTATGATVTVKTSSVLKLDRAEFDSIKYTMDLTGRKDAVLQKNVGAASSVVEIPKHDYLAVTAIDETNPASLKRGYINKISLTKGHLEKRPSAATDLQVYRATLTIPADAYFTKVGVNVQGNFTGDGAASTNAIDGSMLDMINEGKVNVFAREFGYDQRLTVDVSKSKDNKLVFTKTNSILMSDGVDIYFEVAPAHRAAVDIKSINFSEVE